MTISRQNISIIIVTYKSEEVIDECLKSIPSDINILIIDNSGDHKFKENIEKKYNNVSCIVSLENLGMGAGNNLGLRQVKTDYALILNPDVVLENETIDELVSAIENLNEFSIIAPICKDENYPNYEEFIKDDVDYSNLEPFKVKSIDGFAMLFNLKRINQLKNFENRLYFDENIFLYLENDDLCKRLMDIKENIYVVPKSKIHHKGASAVSKKYSHQIELSRNWHWIWSKFYFNKKHKGYITALLNGLPTFLSSSLKFLFYSITINKKKREIYLFRAYGYLSAAFGKKSYLRPNIDI